MLFYICGCMLRCMNTLANINELARAIRNMIRTGVIVETDLNVGRCRVQTGGNITDWLQWLTIRARSADFRGTLNSRREESWHDKTLGDIVAVIAARNKLTASVTPALAGIHIPHIDQTQESDARFLTRLANRNGGEVSVKMDK